MTSVWYDDGVVGLVVVGVAVGVVRVGVGVVVVGRAVGVVVDGVGRVLGGAVVGGVVGGGVVGEGAVVVGFAVGRWWWPGPRWCFLVFRTVADALGDAVKSAFGRVQLAASAICCAGAELDPCSTVKATPVAPATHAAVTPAIKIFRDFC